MRPLNPSNLRRGALACASALVLAGLAACDQPRAPEPLPPPPAEEMEPDWGPEDQPPVEMDDGGYDDRAPPPMDEPPPYEEPYGEPEPLPPVAMEPIPNPPGADEYGRRLRPGARPAERLEARPRDDGKPPIEDAADARPYAPRAEERFDAPTEPGTMAPIPNPPERAGRTPRRDDGLLGAPSTRPATADRRPAAPVAPPPPPAVNGPVARTPIAPAAPGAAARSSAAAAPTPGRVGGSSASASGASASAAAADASAPPAESTLETAERTLRERVARDARLETPAAWTAGQTEEVRLRLPQGFSRDLANAGAGLSDTPGLAEITATLQGDGFRIDPAGPQSISADSADSGFVWRVTPERADPGQLSARLEASVPLNGGRRTLPLGEVGRERADGGLNLSPATWGWILLVIAVGALIAWLAGRRPASGETPENRRRRRVRAEQQRQARPAPFDFRPGDAGSDARPADDRTDRPAS